MTVQEPIPCSFFDIPGLQSWLDEKARQGLFLERFNYHLDRAVFETDDPRPVRYRLDPVGRSKKKDRERAELYREAGWTHVADIPRAFHIFSCEDPDAPELYSDPQSLSLALSGTIRAQIRYQLTFALAIILFVGGLLFFFWGIYWEDLLLWTHPRNLFTLAVAAILFPGLFLAVALDLRKLFKIRRTLAQGLPLKAKKRWNRPRWIIIWLAVYLTLNLTLNLFPRLFLEDYRPEICGLDEAVLSHPWPTAAQLEAAGPDPLTEEPAADGYATTNDSWFAPIQEYISTDWETREYVYWTGVRYLQARSPKTAELLYRLERDKEIRYQKKAVSFPNANRITEVQPFQPWDWPGLDRAELTRCHRRGQDIWTLLLLRGRDVLMVEYSGQAQPETCIPLFLEALDKEVTP